MAHEYRDRPRWRPSPALLVTAIHAMPPGKSEGRDAAAGSTEVSCFPRLCGDLQTYTRPCVSVHYVVLSAVRRTWNASLTPSSYICLRNLILYIFNIFPLPHLNGWSTIVI